jgi:hypothetical protein
MTESSSPDPEIVRFIATILAARETAATEVPMLITSLRGTLELLRNGGALPAATVKPAAVKRRTPPRKPVTEAAAAPPRRGRGRPRKLETVIEERSRRPEPATAAPVAPRLMRRAEVAPTEPSILDVRPPQQMVLHGVVRWFDQRTRHGLLRLPGFSEDIAIDTAMLEKAGISRLYKGKEIEATVTGENADARLVALALPGRAAEPANGLFKSGSKAGTARRHAKPVVVEMKRDAIRRAAARVEAEHVLGNGRRRPV